MELQAMDKFYVLTRFEDINFNPPIEYDGKKIVTLWTTLGGGSVSFDDGTRVNLWYYNEEGNTEYREEIINLVFQEVGKIFEEQTSIKWDAFLENEFGY